MTPRLAIDGGTPVRKTMLPLTVPFFDNEDLDAVSRVVQSTFVSGDGPECRAFERELAAYLNVKHAFFTSSCTAALDLAFMVKGFPPGSEVIVPNFTFTSSALGPILNGLKVVLVDVDPENGNIDIGEVEAKITSRTVAVVPVDYAGNPVDMDPLNALGRSQLRKLDAMNKRRDRIAEYYISELARYGSIRLPKGTPEAKANWHLFYLLVEPRLREWFVDAVRAEGIMANTHYSPLHINRYYREMCAARADDFPQSMRFFNSMVRIPMHTVMSAGDAEDVVTAVRKVVEASASVPASSGTRIRA